LSTKAIVLVAGVRVVATKRLCARSTEEASDEQGRLVIAQMVGLLKGDTGQPGSAAHQQTGS